MRRRNSNPAARGSDVNWDSEQQILPLILDGRTADVLECFDRALDAIEAALKARRVQYPRRTQKGIVVSYVRPDHGAALKAVEQFLNMLTVGRPVPKPKRASPASFCGIDEAEAAMAAFSVEQLPVRRRAEARAELAREWNRPWSSPKSDTAALQHLVTARNERLEQLFERTLKTIHEGLEPSRTITPAPRNIQLPVDLGPDHGIRSRAAKLLLKILTAGRPRLRANEPERIASFESLLQRHHT